jgi:anti-anti-sigma regulatory factor
MNSGKILAADYDGVPVLKFVGDVRVVMSSTLDRYFAALLARSSLEAVLVDLSETRAIDSARNPTTTEALKRCSKKLTFINAIFSRI